MMKIALTYTGSEEKHDNYVRWLMAGDDKIEVITLSAEKNNAAELAGCDALVLSGGVDVHPRLYGKEAAYPNAPSQFNVARDEFESGIYLDSQKAAIPVLAVCRGMQLVNCISGGDLVQDLGKDGNGVHRANGVLDKAHGATIQRDSLLYDIVKEERVVMNSAHHQAIGKTGDGLVVSCLSDDGIIEGMERTAKEGKPFLLCIQWHPERMYKFHLQGSPVSLAIRNRFIEEIKKNRMKK